MTDIPLSECVDRCLYRIRSRNLTLGVFRQATGGFIGIRTKFGHRYLFEEYHNETSMHSGTVSPQELIRELPSDIVCSTSRPIHDYKSGRPVRFDGPIKQGGRGWVFLDTDTPDANIEPRSDQNLPLLAFLELCEKEHTPPL